MSRTFPLVVLGLATVLGVGLGMGSSTALRRLVAVPDGEVPELNAGGGGPVARANTAAAPRTPAVKRTSDMDYLQGILCRNLFDPAKVGQCPIKEEKGPDDRETITELNVTLLGTLVAEPAVFSSALILEDGQERAIGYSLHDKIHDAEIIAIEKKLVRLKRGDGKEEILTMDEDAPQPKRNGPAPAAAEESGDDEVNKVSETEYEIDSAVLDKYLSDLEGLSRMGRALLHRGPDGEFDGYRLSAIRRNTIADKLGIRNGDIVHAVNGKPLNSMTSAMDAYNTMQNEKAFSFEVTRRGQKMTMQYSVK
ncbi:MAG: PDZ domain-containing protein [Alphaproteobacteria bacterium]|nr:PDZ domain-containing protein [Alphaproteobacteria bacterium]MCB9692122.1 PDZ domain-containing protein [Alphaproteobacteria bacterium]